MSENPNMNFKDAQAESARLMQGNKWKTFVLDLSFIGWMLLSIITFWVALSRLDWALRII